MNSLNDLFISSVAITNVNSLKLVIQSLLFHYKHCIHPNSDYFKIVYLIMQILHFKEVLKIDYITNSKTFFTGLCRISLFDSWIAGIFFLLLPNTLELNIDFMIWL